MCRTRMIQVADISTTERVSQSGGDSLEDRVDYALREARVQSSPVVVLRITVRVLLITRSCFARGSLGAGFGWGGGGGGNNIFVSVSGVRSSSSIN